MAFIMPPSVGERRTAENNMIELGLIGKTLKHSFSPAFFQELWQELGLAGSYRLFELESIAHFPEIKKHYPNLAGVNVTIPYKTLVLDYVNESSPEVEAIGACNTLLYTNDGKIKAFNTDVIGLEGSLQKLTIDRNINVVAILGTGGTSKTAQYVVNRLFPNAEVLIFSRNPETYVYHYDSLKDAFFFKKIDLFINTTPAGMFPNVNDYPPIPLELLSDHQMIFDAIYNPPETMFLRKAKERGCSVTGGTEMLRSQALGAWRIWNDYYGFVY
jgi:shikimate dehydrogenase